MILNLYRSNTEFFNLNLNEKIGPKTPILLQLFSCDKRSVRSELKTVIIEYINDNGWESSTNEF